MKRNPDNSTEFKGRMIIEYTFTDDDNGEACVESLTQSLNHLITQDFAGADGMYDMELKRPQFSEQEWKDYLFE